MKARNLTKETINQVGVTPRNFPEFVVGDTVAVSQRIVEGDKERLQVFEGDVIAIHNNGVSTTFVVRKIGAHGIAVERIFPYYSPRIKSIEVIKRGDVSRSKLYYLRDRVGKAARVKEKIVTKEQLETQAVNETAAE
jgi:large subunit ribosomal protein L19